MTTLDKATAAITPPESEEARQEARRKAEVFAVPGGWLATILEHHRGIEAQSEAMRRAPDAQARRAEEKKRGALLTAHSLAEEAAVYPALANGHQVGHAELAYQEQSAAKMELGLLERPDPMSEIISTRSSISVARSPIMCIPSKAPGSPTSRNRPTPTSRTASLSAMTRNMAATPGSDFGTARIR